MKLFLLGLLCGGHIAQAVNLSPGDHGTVAIDRGDVTLTTPGTYTGGFLFIGEGNLVLRDPGEYRLDFDVVTLRTGNVQGPGEATELQVRGPLRLVRGEIRGAMLAVNTESVMPPDIVTPAPLMNISTRAILSSGETVTPGWVVGGWGPRRVLIRVVGPGLADFNIKGMDDPRFRLMRGTEEIAANDNWETDGVKPFSDLVGAFPLAPGSKDAALVAMLEPGAYSAIVTGVGNGEVLIEVYFIE